MEYIFKYGASSWNTLIIFLGLVFNPDIISPLTL
jgi:hypothetical protein